MADDLRALICEAPGWGWLGLVAAGQGLRYVGLPAPTRAAAAARLHRHYADATFAPDAATLVEAARQICAYLAGAREPFNVALDLRGHNPFALAVWAATARIPYGETRTYAWVATQAGGASGAAQAAGAALGDNPVPLIIPCHRVLGADGSLHGFAGGLSMKARLLALENGQVSLGLDAES